MQCPDCGSDNTHEFLAEEITCSHCDELNVITYNMCEECGIVWKAVDGKTFTKLAYIDGFLDAVDVETNGSDQGSMQDLIHKCLRCGAISYEVGKEQYKCSDCGFEWRVS